MDDEKAEIIKRIYHDYLLGHTLARISNDLNKRGIQTASRKSEWRPSTVRSILTNEKYTGDVLAQKTYVEDIFSRRTRKNNGELPMVYIKNNHIAIVDRGIFQQVQMELSRRTNKPIASQKSAHQPQSKYTRYALSTLLVCGECGSRWKRISWSKGKKHWRCEQRILKQVHLCSHSPMIPENMLHDVLVSICNQWLEDTGMAKALYDKLGSTSKRNRILSLMQERIRRKNMLDSLHAADYEGVMETRHLEYYRLRSDSIKIDEDIALIMKNTAASRTPKEIQSLFADRKGKSPKLTRFHDDVLRLLVEAIWIQSPAAIRVMFVSGVYKEFDVDWNTGDYKEVFALCI